MQYRLGGVFWGGHEKGEKWRSGSATECVVIVEIGRVQWCVFGG